jgi:hypothetical protein
MRFTYTGTTATEVLLTIEPGDSIDVPLSVAGSRRVEELDDDGILAAVDHGSGLLAQPDRWSPDEPEDLEILTVPELRDRAEKAGIDVASNAKKADLIAALTKEG